MDSREPIATTILVIFGKTVWSTGALDPQPCENEAPVGCFGARRWLKWMLTILDWFWGWFHHMAQLDFSLRCGSVCLIGG